MKKYLVGSKLLGLQNAHDTDILLLDEEEEERVDIHYCTKSFLFKRMNFELPIEKPYINAYLHNYQLDADIIGQNFPYEYHILDQKDKYIELLTYLVDNKLMGFGRGEKYNCGQLLKSIYHVAYIAFIMQNNSTELTEEQKAIIQKIHDNQMPQEYLDELVEIISNLQ